MWYLIVSIPDLCNLITFTDRLIQKLLFFSAIEDSINLAVDSGVNKIIITADFNLNKICKMSNQPVKILLFVNSSLWFNL